MNPNPLLRRSALLLALLAAAIGGCSPKSDVLARVNDRNITIEDFNDVGRRAGQQYPGAPDSARTKLLNDLVQRELLLQGAFREKLNATPEFEAFHRRLERASLREALFQKLMAGPFTVSAAEVKEFYDRRGTATHTRLIFAFTEDVARRALAELNRGDDFAAVAGRYNPAGMVPPDGDIGWVLPGSLLPPLDDTVRTASLNRPLGPIEAPGEGWIVLRLEGRKVVPHGTLEAESQELEEMLRQRKQRVTLLHEVDKLRAGHELKVLSGAGQAMVGQFRPKDAAAAMQAPPVPGPEARAQKLATYTGGAYTLGDAYDDLMAGSNRPNLDVLPAVEKWIEAQTLERAALDEAKSRRLDQEPAVKKKIQQQIDNYLLDAYYQRQVMQLVRPSAEDVAAAYERYKASFAQLRTARVQSVLVRDSAQAVALATHAGQASTLRDAAATAGLGARVRDEKIVFAKATPQWSQFAGRIASMNPGEIAGPYPTPGGSLVFQLVEKLQSAPPLDSLSAGARSQLEGVAGEVQRERRLTALTDSLRKIVKPVTIYADRLQRLPWPPPAAPPGS